MALTTVRLEDADDPDTHLPVSFQLMAAVPRVGERLWLGSPDDTFEVVSVLWRLREQTGRDLETQVDLMVRRVPDDQIEDWDTVTRIMDDVLNRVGPPPGWAGREDPR